MATILTKDTQYFNRGSNLNYTNQLFALLSRHSNKFTHEDESEYIEVDNRMTLHVRQSDNGWAWIKLQIDVINPENNSVIAAFITGIQDGTFSVDVYKGDDTIVFKIGNAATLTFIFKSNSVYFTSRSVAIETTTGQAIADSYSLSTNYTVKKIADYSLSIRDLFFTDTCVILNPDGEYDVIQDFSSCSNVTYNTTLSLNNKNYYAIGTNTLIEYVEGN